MNDEWSQNKLSLNTKQTLSNMFGELDADHVQQAFDLHVHLVRNASSEVSKQKKRILSNHFCFSVFFLRLFDLSSVSND